MDVTPSPSVTEIVVYLSPQGDDRWSGRLPAPAADRTDGPLATPAAAQALVRRLLASPPPVPRVRVCLRGGTYFLEQPLVFTPADSGRPEQGDWTHVAAPEQPVVWSACEDEEPVLSGGRRLSGWQVGDWQGRPVWTVDLPEVKAGTWTFRQLWVNGQRRWRPRLPRTGEYRVAEVLDAGFEGGWAETVRRGSNRFGYRPGDLDPHWTHLTDVELLFRTLWVGVYAHIQAIEEATHRVTMDRNSGIRLTYDFGREGAAYVVENVFEALAEPGQWYLDRTAGRLYYLPCPGEDPATAEVIAPRLAEVIRLAGEPDAGPKVEGLRFVRLTFAHTEWTPGPTTAGANQAAADLPGAVTACHARRCHFRYCRFTHLATYGLELVADCSDFGVHGCDFDDLGAGGVKVWHGCRRNVIADCELGPGGCLWPAGVGVLIGKASGNQVLHNHVHHFYYTGISVGWTWGYAEGDAYGNVIEDNHLHDLGQGRLSDLAGIYTLGVAPGTRIRGNVIHDVSARTYGGSGIYPDEGSSYLLIEGNLVYRTGNAAFYQHYGRENVVRNNIFAADRLNLISRGRVEPHVAFIFERNLVYLTAGSLLNHGYGATGWSPADAAFRRNLYWDATGRPLDFDGRDFAAWQALGLDADSLVADPLFVAPEQGDFRLRPGSPAAQIGFIPLELDGVGPRPAERWQPS